MPDLEIPPAGGIPEKLSPRWRQGTILLIGVELLVLGWITLGAYRGNVGPPIPETVRDEDGNTLFTGGDIRAGQAIFLKYALMDQGTIWGHGAYFGPDFSAVYLHALALETREALAVQTFRQPYATLGTTEQLALQGQVHAVLGWNRYDRRSGVLTYSIPETNTYHQQMDWWKNYFSGTQTVRGLLPKAITSPEELRPLVSFFAWTAWAAAALVPGKDYSYTNNFPYDPAVGNGPSASAILWSALSLIALLGGIALILLAFGRFHYLGWHGTRDIAPPQCIPGQPTESQRATLKYFLIVPVLLLGQSLIGGAMAHSIAQPGSFYGLDLSRYFPVNILRSWHLQMAILWIATACVGGGLFLASVVGGREPRRQTLAINLLFGAMLMVIVGSLAGEYLGAGQYLSNLWFWFGNQGWEYLEIGRVWQFLLAIGLTAWVLIMVRTVRPTLRDRNQREIAVLFLLTSFAIPLFYLPAFLFDSTSNFTLVDTWRFWIIHLWVEDIFELFATVMVAVMFLNLGLVTRVTATRVIYLDAILFLGAGILGTGHHWYWSGQNTLSMAISSVFGTMEVIPLVLLTLEASDFTGLMRSGRDSRGNVSPFPHRWTFYFLIAVGVWNFIGAGVFGFLINLPVVSYYETGTNLTSNHGHGALMGVFGMLGIALLVFGLRQTSSDQHWKRVEKYIRVSFWGLNLGLAGMLILNLFPMGVLQFLDVITHGYWHARSSAFSGQPLISGLNWARLPADIAFIVAGVVPLLIATVLTWRKERKAPEEHPAGRGSTEGEGTGDAS